MLLENRDKSLGFVNGQFCTIHCMVNATAMARHPHGHFINIYPVTDAISKVTYFPFTAAYASTISKVQGQTMNEAILCLESNLLNIFLFLRH